MTTTKQKEDIRIPQWLAKDNDIPQELNIEKVVAETDKAYKLKVSFQTKESSLCMRCGRELSHPVSVQLGIGPTCAEKMGIEWTAPEKDPSEADLKEQRELIEKQTWEDWLPKSQIDGRVPEDNEIEGEIRLDDTTIIIDVDYDEGLVNEIKGYPRREFNGDDETWKVPLGDWQLVDRTANKFDIPIVDDLEMAHQKLKERRQQSRAESADEEIEMGDGELYPFQVAGVKYVENTDGNALIGDEMGLGKTIQSLAYLERNNRYPALIVPPASLQMNWKKEIERWTDRSVKIAESTEVTDEDIDGHDIFIINYSKIWRNQTPETLKNYGFKALVGDESHKIKNKDSNQGSCFAKTLAPEIEDVMLLTGTPILNRPKELVNQLKALDKLGHFGGEWSFLMRFTSAEKGRFGWDFSGSSHEEELQEKLREACMVRREKDDVLDELPDKRENKVYFEIDNRKEYQKAKKEFQNFVERQAKDSRQYYAILDDEGKEEAERFAEEKGIKAKRAEQLVKLNVLKQVTAKGKLDSVVDWTENTLKQEEKVILFAHHKETISSLMEELDEYDPVKLTGDMPDEARDDSVEAFQKGSSRVFIGSIQASGVGLTLTAASTVAFVELAWNKATHDQASDRAHRIGQDENVDIYYLLAENTIDGYVMNMIEEKGEIQDLVTSLTDEG